MRYKNFRLSTKIRIFVPDFVPRGGKGKTRRGKGYLLYIYILGTKVQKITIYSAALRRCATPLFLRLCVSRICAPAPTQGGIFLYLCTRGRKSLMRAGKNAVQNAVQKGFEIWGSGKKVGADGEKRGARGGGGGESIQKSLKRDTKRGIMEQRAPHGAAKITKEEKGACFMRKRMSSWAAFCTIVGWICVVVGLGAALFTRFSTLGVALAGISSLFFAACLEWMDGVLEYLYEIREQQKTMTEYVYAQAMGLKIDREERREREAQERAAQEAQADPQPTQRRRRTEHPGGFDAE